MLPDSLWQLRPPPPPPPLSSSVLHLLVLLSLHAARAPRSRLSASQPALGEVYSRQDPLQLSIARPELAATVGASRRALV